MASKDAENASLHLLNADLAGVDSHGIARLSGYIRLVNKGRVNLTPDIKIIHQTLSTATVDADAALGLVAAPYCMQLAIEKARTAGSGWVAVQNSNHFGIAGQYAQMAIDAGMIGIAMTNASALVAPTFGKDRMLGTNPIAVGFPTLKQPPFLADFATTTAANGKLEILQRKQQDAPNGWLQDANGRASNMTDAVKNGGALLPLGGAKENGGHKGYALGSIVDIFSAVVSGANYGPWVPPFVAFLEPKANPVGKGLGHFFGAFRVDAFRPAEDYFSHIDNWISTVRSTTPVDPSNPVQIPGDAERLCKAERLTHGIPLLEAVVDDIKILADMYHVSMPMPINA